MSIARPERLASVAASAILIALLGACANPRADQALIAQRSLVGMSKQDLLSCAGVPDRSATIDNTDYFTYTSRRTAAYSSASAFWGSRYGYPGWRHGFGFPYYDAYDLRTYACDATFTLRNGIVERVVYGGDVDGASRLGQCYAIVENCLGPPPQAAAAGPH